VLEHVECPRCDTANLTSEVVCFACGAWLRPRRLPKHRASPTPAAPWVMWVGLLLGLAAAGLVALHVTQWVVAQEESAGRPVWHLPAAGALLVAAGQAGFTIARGIDRRWWRLKRAPGLKLGQAHTEDAVWVRGRLECDTPLIAPYVAKPCAYYRVVVREREEGQSGWQVKERETRAVDFRLVEESRSVYVPSGGVLFDAPWYIDTFIDPGGSAQARLWVLAVDMPVSVCGRLAGETARPRMDALGEGLPVVATWREPEAYCALVARRARRAQIAGWVATMVGGLALISAAAGM